MTTDDDLEDLLSSWELSLRATGKSPQTVINYLAAAKTFAGHLDRSLLEADADDIRRFTVEQLERHTSSTAASRFRCLQQFYRWALDEELIEVSPMEGMAPPALTEKVVPIIPDEDLRALLAVCDGKDFEDLRDRALMLFLLDTGARLGELVGCEVDSITAKAQEAVVHGKGDRSRRVYFSAATAVALDRYERRRKSHEWGRSPAYWLGSRGPLTGSGVTQLLRRRGKQAEIGHLHPHMFRHTWAHLMKVAGMADDEVMELGGWRTNQMLVRYGSSARAERAKSTYQRIAPGDRL